LLESLLFTRYRSFAACQWQKPLRGFHQGPCAPLKFVLFGCGSLTVLSSIISHPSPFLRKAGLPGCFIRFLQVTSSLVLLLLLALQLFRVSFLLPCCFSDPNFRVPVLQGICVFRASPGSPTSQAIRLFGYPPRSASFRKTLSGSFADDGASSLRTFPPDSSILPEGLRRGKATEVRPGRVRGDEREIAGGCPLVAQVLCAFVAIQRTKSEI
jgi:hypothetical protein